ncbi:MAG: Uma2 family endonuclease [Verrucomicrobiota bacterium]
MTWKELCVDRRFQDLPFKVELNGRGQIITSPTRNSHGYLAFRIGELLRQHLPDGEVIVECGVETTDGTKEADVAWLTKEHFAKVRDEFSCSTAPEICVEVTSPGNSRAELLTKKSLYLGAGAREYWLCHETGRMEFFGPVGKMRRSKLAPKFPLHIQ